MLVLGAAGFFGLAIVRALTAGGVPVFASDRIDAAAFRPRSGTDERRLRYVQRDITQESLDDLLAGTQGIVHAAALTPRDEAAGDTADELLRVNLESLLSALPAARRAGCDRVLFVSSAGVYDQQADRALTEDDADGGTSLYGAAKLAGELVARRYAQVVGLDFAAVRPTSLFGAGEMVRPSRPRITAFAQLVAAAQRDEAVRIEHGEARADWLCVDDAADAVALLWSGEHLGGRVFNLSSGRLRRFRDVADEVVEATGLRLDASARTIVDGGADRAALIDNRRVCDALGWQPRRTVGEEARALLQEREHQSAPGGAR